MPVVPGPAGLVTVDLPASVTDGEVWLHWAPPGQTLGYLGAIAGLFGALALTVVQCLQARRRRADED
jgi:hypothetical protein